MRFQTVMTACGGTAESTRETTPSTIWKASVEDACLVLARDGNRSQRVAAYLQTPIARERLSRYWADRMPVWMATDALFTFAVGAIKAEDDDATDDRNVMRNAWRKAVHS